MTKEHKILVLIITILLIAGLFITLLANEKGSMREKSILNPAPGMVF